MDDLEKTQGTSTILLQAVCIMVNSNWSYSPETPSSGQNRPLFVLCEPEIWRMTLKNNRAPLLCYLKLCSSIHSHWSIQTGVTPNSGQNRPFFVPCDLGSWVISSWSYSPETPNSGRNRWFFATCDLEIWQMTLKDNKTPLLCWFKLCAWFHCNMRIQTGVTVQKWLCGVLTSVTLAFDLDLLHGHHFCPW